MPAAIAVPPPPVAAALPAVELAPQHPVDFQQANLPPAEACVGGGGWERRCVANLKASARRLKSFGISPLAPPAAPMLVRASSAERCSSALAALSCSINAVAILSSGTPPVPPVAPAPTPPAPPFMLGAGTYAGSPPLPTPSPKP